MNLKSSIQQIECQKCEEKGNAYGNKDFLLPWVITSAKPRGNFQENIHPFITFLSTSALASVVGDIRVEFL